MAMNDALTHTEKKAQQGQFFPISMLSIRRLLHEGGGANELGTYIVLARGAGARSSTAWTENAVTKYLGITGSRAEKACQWLVEHGFLRPASTKNNEALAETADGSLDDEAAKKLRRSRHKWQVLQEGSQVVRLPNSLVNGIGTERNIRPLQVLFQEIEVDHEHGIDAHVARLDALMLLMELYAKQDLEQYGGIDPGVWHKKWIFVDSDNSGNIAETPLCLFEAEEGEEFLSTHFARTAFCYVEGDAERLVRFRHAFANLKKLGFFYEVLQVWSDDPLENADAEVLYPLYLFDRYARENGEPALYREIARIAVMKYQEDGSADEVFDKDGRFLLNDSELFRYVAYERNYAATPLSVLRLRYRAWDRDTGIGLAEQQRLVDDWTSVLRWAL